MCTQQYALGRVYFCNLDTDLRDLEKPGKPHKFCNIRIMVMHALCSFLYFPLIKTPSVILEGWEKGGGGGGGD